MRSASGTRSDYTVKAAPHDAQDRAGGAERAEERINTEERSSGDERSWFFDRLGWRVRRGLPEKIVEGLIVVELRSVTTLPVHQTGATYPDARCNDREDDLYT